MASLPESYGSEHKQRQTLIATPLGKIHHLKSDDLCRSMLVALLIFHLTQGKGTSLATDAAARQ